MPLIDAQQAACLLGGPVHFQTPQQRRGGGVLLWGERFPLGSPEPWGQQVARCFMSFVERTTWG